MNQSIAHFRSLALATLLALSVSACQDSATESTAQSKQATQSLDKKSASLQKAQDFFDMKAEVPHNLITLDDSLKDKALIERYLDSKPQSTHMVYTRTINGQPESGAEIITNQQHTLARMLEDGKITNNLIDKNASEKEDSVHILIWKEGETEGIKTSNPFLLLSIEMVNWSFGAEQFSNPLFGNYFHAETEKVNGVQMVKVQMPSMMSDETEIWFYPTEKYLIPARVAFDDDGEKNEYIYKKYVLDEPIAPETFTAPKEVDFTNLDAMMNLDIFKGE